MEDTLQNSTNMFKRLASNPPELKRVFIFICGLNLTFLIFWLGGANQFSKIVDNLSKKSIFFLNNSRNSTAESGKGNKDVWKCTLPDKDPWHADMLSYINSHAVGPMDKCKPSFVEMTSFEFSSANSTLSVKNEFSKAHKCRYRCIRPLNDYEYEADEWEDLITPVQPNCDVFEVDCSLKAAENKTVYNNLYYQIYRPPVNVTKKLVVDLIKQPPTEKKRDLKKEKKTFGVHIIVLDSVSRSNFVRSLPKTMYLLKEEYEAISFDHLNKAGLNSMPNAFAFLFGRQMENMPKSPFNNKAIPPDPGFDRPTICNKNLDDEASSLLLIFKNLGYKMMMAEDWARGALNWPACLGFKTKPVDHYMRPFQIRLAELGESKLEKSQCREPYLSLLEYLKQFLGVYQDEPQKFSLVWSSWLTHDYLNQLYHADDTFYKFFKEEQSKMEDSFVFFMADHGLRFGGHRSTATGIMEDNNPGLFIALPKQLRSNIKLKAQMRENAKQLISHHDLYATLLTIARSSHMWDDTDWDSEWNAREYEEALHGSSLFHTLTKQPRDCPTLRIPFAYCQCEQKYTEIKPSLETNELINQLAMASVDKLNKEIAKHKYEDKCMTLSLDEGNSVVKLEELQVERLGTGEEVKDKPSSGIFRITFQTKPGAGQFSGFLKVSYNKETIVVREKREEATSVKRVSSIEFISELFDRLNSHGDQSGCAEKEASIRPYCYCKEQPPKTP